MRPEERTSRSRMVPWLVWFLVAFSLNAVLDLAFDVTWWVRWAVVVTTIPIMVVGSGALTRR